MDAAVDPATVAARLDIVRERIRRAGADPDVITVVAVTKGFGPESVAAAIAAGLADVGENYALDLIAKRASGPPGARWHFIGLIQRNKVRGLAPAVDVWQSVDRLAAGQAIAAHAPKSRVMVEVNTTGEASKGGCRPEQAGELVSALRELDLVVTGLMTVGPAGPPEGARASFAKLATLARQFGLPELSMGMSGDLEVAVQEGATMVRLGTALFGPRRYPVATIG
jgi:pyridoxal phosphate enzyme (YggS family)